VIVLSPAKAAGATSRARPNATHASILDMGCSPFMRREAAAR
jgi:hypothetical protein